MLTGMVLVLLTWVMLTCLVFLTGLRAALSFEKARPTTDTWRASLWFGVAGLTLTVGIASLAWPLEGSFSAVLVLSVGLALGCLGLLRLRAAGGADRSVPRRLGSAGRLTVLALAGVVCFEAAAVLGPVTNYDTGLYHWGAIRYVAEHGTIPGLANLYFPFGYANAWFPNAAMLGNGPWQADGFRLLNGLLIVLVSADVVLRLYRPMRWGTWTMLIGIAACFMPLIGIADFWVASPTSDTAVMLLTLVTVAALADTLSDGAARDRAIVIVTSCLLVAIRPTMLPFALAAILIVCWRTRNRGPRSRERFSRSQMTGISLFLLTLVVVQVLRDRLLSGWLLYPLSIWNFDVPWLAQDPTAQRDATLAAARNPLAADQWAVAHSWEWIVPWFWARWSLWETYLFLILTGAALACVIVARRRGVLRDPRLLVISAAPSALGLLAWFLVSPPSYRFAWGPLFTLPIVVLAGAWTSLASGRSRRTSWSVISIATVLVGVTAFSALFRLDASTLDVARVWAMGSIRLEYAVAQLPAAPVEIRPTTGGLDLQVPTQGDQCWTRYPLCTPFPDQALSWLGTDLAGGLRR